MNKKILIIGGGVAGYLTALRYKTVFKNYEIDLIQSKKIGIIGVGESSLLDIPSFLFHDCELDIDSFHKEITPTFKLGLQTRDWFKKGKIINYTFDIIYLMHIYGIDILNNINDINYSFFSTLINEKKPPITINNELISGNRLESPYLHAYQIENKKFIPYLQKQAKLKNINEIEGEILDIKHDEESINKVYFNDNWYSYDFYIDCSGFNGCITNFIKNEWFSFKDYIVCDSVILGEHEIDETPNHCSIAHAMSNGWMFQIDTFGRTGKGYIYNSSTISEEMAIEEYMQKNEMKVKNIRKIKFKSGYYKNIFNKNYCLVGNCAGFTEPLEATGYTIIINTINLLIKNHLKKEKDLFLTESEIKANNIFIYKMWQETLNLIITHYKFNDHYKNDFWEYCKNLNFFGDFNEIIKYLFENDFSFSITRELQISYGRHIFIPIEGFLLILKSKNLIKNNKIINKSNYFIQNKEKIITYQKMQEEKKYEEYFNKKIDIFNFLK